MYWVVTANSSRNIHTCLQDVGRSKTVIFVHMKTCDIMTPFMFDKCNKRPSGEDLTYSYQSIDRTLTDSWTEPLVGAERAFIEHCSAMFNEIQSYFDIGNMILNDSNKREIRISREDATNHLRRTENRRIIQYYASNACHISAVFWILRFPFGINLPGYWALLSISECTHWENYYIIIL